MISDNERKKMLSDAKPRIRRNTVKHGTRCYPWRCEGRGSIGFGYSPYHAFIRWDRNLKLRIREDANRRPDLYASLLRRVK